MNFCIAETENDEKAWKNGSLQCEELKGRKRSGDRFCRSLRDRYSLRISSPNKVGRMGLSGPASTPEWFVRLVRLVSRSRPQSRDAHSTRCNKIFESISGNSVTTVTIRIVMSVFLITSRIGDVKCNMTELQ